MTDFWYNLSSVNGNNGMLGFMQSVNDTFFFHLFGTMILIVLYVIIFRATLSYNNNPKVSMLYTSFLMVWMALFFRLLQLVQSDSVIFVFIGLFLLSILFQFWVD